MEYVISKSFSQVGRTLGALCWTVAQHGAPNKAWLRHRSRVHSQMKRPALSCVPSHDKSSGLRSHIIPLPFKKTCAL